MYLGLSAWRITDERMSSGGLNATTFRKAQRLKKELNLNINTNTAITYTHCYSAFLNDGKTNINEKRTKI